MTIDCLNLYLPFACNCVVAFLFFLLSNHTGARVAVKETRREEVSLPWLVPRIRSLDISVKTSSKGGPQVWIITSCCITDAYRSQGENIFCHVILFHNHSPNIKLKQIRGKKCPKEHQRVKSQFCQLVTCFSVTILSWTSEGRTHMAHCAVHYWAGWSYWCYWHTWLCKEVLFMQGTMKKAAH